MNTTNKNLKPLFEMASIYPIDTGLEIEVSIDMDRSKHYARVKFNPENGETDKKKWPYVRVDGLIVEGKYNDKKIDSEVLSNLKNWVKENKENIIRVFNKEIDWNFFQLFLRFTKSQGHFKNFPYIRPECSGIPLWVWIDDKYYHKGKKAVVSIVCTNEDEEIFVGVVNVIDTKQTIFIKGYEKYADSISTWAKKYRRELIDVSRGKMSGDDFCGMVSSEYAFNQYE
jgi:hypothetical protein